MSTAGSWRTGYPTAGHVVEVWHGNAVLLGYFDGKDWRTVDGAPLSEISHWREKDTTRRVAVRRMFPQ